MKMVFDKIESTSFEDGDEAMVIEMTNADNPEGNPFLRLHSWDEEKKHPGSGTWRTSGW